MRITGFHVDGFGLLHDARVDGVPAGTTVVLGPNEAGKSTLHAFLVRTLFGHPRRGNADGLHRFEPLRGGRHGGMVTCEDEHGRWEVHRRPGSSPALRVVRPDGTEATGQDAVVDLLGHEVDATRFEQVFAVDLDDLAGVGALGDGALDDLLFDAATVGTGRSLRAARDEAVERRDGLWTPTARKRPLALAVAERDEARAALVAARDEARRNLDVRRQLDEAVERVAELGDRQRQLQTRIVLLERVIDAWPSWSRAIDLRARLEDTPEVEVDLAVVEQARDAAARQARSSDQQAELEADRDALEQRLAAVSVDHRLLEHGDRIDELAEQRSAHDLRVERLEEAQHAHEAARRALASALDDLGDGWDAARVRATAVDAASRTELSGAATRLRETVAELAAARQRAEEAGRVATRRADAAAAIAADAPQAPDPAAVADREAAVAVLRSSLPLLDQPGALPAAPTAAELPPRVLAAGLAVAVVALVATLLGVPGAGLVLALVCGAGVALLVARRVRPAADDTSHAVAGTGRSTVAQDVAAAAELLGLDPRPDRTAVERAAIDVAAERASLAAVAEADRALGAARDEEREARAAANDAAAATEAAQSRAAAAHEHWVEVSRRVGLDPEDAPEVALVRHEHVGAARRALTDLDRLAHERARLQDDVSAHEQDVAAALAALGHDLEPGAAVRALPGVRDDLHDMREAAAEVARRRTALDELDVRLARVAEQARAAGDELATCLDSLGVADVSALTALVRAADERQDVVSALAAAEGEVERLLGSGGRGEEGRRLLELADPLAWQQQLADLRADEAAAGEERDAALALRTELETRLDHLGGDDAVPRAEQAVAAAEVAVAEHAEQWAIADTAARMLDETIARFEDEQQPRVLTRASALFERATGGVWSQVRRLEDQVVVAREQGGEPVPAAVLSRGTREQLWLSMRLALAEDLSRHRPLPLLVDDLLGTSDPERSRNVARVLADVARRQQVWLFTCHPATAALVLRTDPGARVLELERGGAVSGWRDVDQPVVDESGDVVLQLEL